MSTPLTDSINALTTYANEVTGASDTTLSDAVHTLASGYGGGSNNEAVINLDTKVFKYSNADRWYAKKTSCFFNLCRFEVVYLDSIEQIDTPYFFNDMGYLKAGIFPMVNSVSNYAFYTVGAYVPNGTVLDFHQVITTGTNGVPFKINNVIFVLRGDEKSSIYIKKGAWGHPSQAKFYVPQILLSEYIADADIVAYGEENILPIEGSPYENIDWWKSLT